jgi:hypothetical protein
VIRLIDILDAFGADALVGSGIALKGGTALNIFHSDLDRLSVDIDVNYVGAIETQRMDADRPGFEDRIERLMESKARRGPLEHAGGKWSGSEGIRAAVLLCQSLHHPLGGRSISLLLTKLAESPQLHA